MSAKSKKLTFAIFVLITCVVVVVSLIARDNLPQYQKGNGYPRGVSYGEKQIQLVDNSLIQYVNLTTNIIQREEGWHPEVGREMGWRAGYANLRWTGSTDDSVKSIQNIYLAVYTRLDQNVTFGKDIKFLTIGLHAIANRTEPTTPNDAIGYQKITIPILGIENPTYSFFFNCSSYF
jgi:hypothetical protein